MLLGLSIQIRYIDGLPFMVYKADVSPVWSASRTCHSMTELHCWCFLKLIDLQTMHLVPEFKTWCD
jgi:hypothetical protein